MTVLFQRLRASARAPQAMTDLAAGYDLSADIPSPLILKAGSRALIPTGWACAIPAGWEGQVRPRSGWALKQGVTVLNAPGTIDADYRGELCVLLINLGDADVEIVPGQRIAQIVFCQVERALLHFVDALPTSHRADGGFGSTGQ